MNGLLVRIGVDHAFGRWNAPADPASDRFVYLPIPERDGTLFHPTLERRYPEFLPPLEAFFAQYGRCLQKDLRFPSALLDQAMHLDPDFSTLTYGDDGARRGAAICSMSSGDLLAFYAGLRPIAPCPHTILYALVGLYVIDEVVPASAVPEDRWHENAHTRKSKRGPHDIVVRARPRVSGRLERCIPIGEYRDRAYRVRNDLLHAWGGLSVKDGYVQRSAVPPSFSDPERFYDWFLGHDIPLIDRNN